MSLTVGGGQFNWIDPFGEQLHSVYLAGNGMYKYVAHDAVLASLALSYRYSYRAYIPTYLGNL